MVDMHMTIASNILSILKQQNKKQTDLAEALQTNKQTVNKMLNGSRMINAVELNQIADFLGVKMEELTKIQGKAMVFMRLWERLLLNRRRKLWR